MISTSTLWKEKLGNYDIPIRDRLTPESFIRITYELTDAEALAAASALSSDAISWSNTSDIVDRSKTYNNILTLEANEWLLDGSYHAYDELLQNTGFVSDDIASGFDFDNGPSIIITFSSVQTKEVNGMTVIWSTTSNEYATLFEILIFNGSILKDTIEITNSSTTSNIETTLSDYDKIIITPLKWSVPKHRARLEQFFIGQDLILNKENIFGYKQDLSGDLLSYNLPEARVSFEIDNIEGKWNPDNPKGFYQYLLERLKLSVEYGYKLNDEIEWHKAGTYYMSGWNTPTNGISASFEAGSLTDFMESMFTYNDGTYTLYDVAEAAFLQSDLPANDDGTNKWFIDECLQDYNVIFPLADNSEYIATCALTILYCANAANCIIRIDIDGNVNIEKINEEKNDYIIDLFTSYSNGEYDILKPLRAFQINNAYNYICSDKGETLSISNPLFQSTSVSDYAEWMKSVLSKRKLISGEYRSDPRLLTFDIITSKNKYAINTVQITDVRYSYAGCFKGSYRGRVLETINQDTLIGSWYSNDIYSGESY